MNPDAPEPLTRRAFDAARLMADHPPRLAHPNKRVVFAVACPPEAVHRGTIRYTRWPAFPLPARLPPAAAGPRVEPRETIYDYAPSPAGLEGATEGEAATEWHVNFADPRLFVAYGSGLFAQDEMQVAEHPALGAIREAWLAEGIDPWTEAEDGRPTPVLLRGVERRCAVAIDRDARAGRPHGLYGRAFAAASADAVRRATRAIHPPTLTHILAMAAPDGGTGPYRRDELERILTTAYTGFAAARRESGAGEGPGRAVIHTGFWGCGAFGGHRVLMPMLQLLAARLAGIERVVFYTVDWRGSALLDAAELALAEKVRGETPAEVLDAIEALGFEWGESDGN